MRRYPMTIAVVLAVTLAGATLIASERSGSSTAAKENESRPKGTATAAVPAAASAGVATKKDGGTVKQAPVAAPRTAAPPPAAAPRQETLEEIVARVKMRLAMEAPQKRPPAATRPPKVERVKLVWRPSIVWPADLAGAEAPAAAPVDPTRVILSGESR